MGGVGAGANNNRDSFISYTASPIVEEPPSPAPGGLEYPDFRNRNQQLDYDAYTVDEDEDGGGETYDQIIEVRARWLRLNMQRNRLSFFMSVIRALRDAIECDSFRLCNILPLRWIWFWFAGILHSRYLLLTNFTTKLVNWLLHEHGI